MKDSAINKKTQYTRARNKIAKANYILINRYYAMFALLIVSQLLYKKS